MIPGTVTVTAPLAPPSTNSPFGTVLPIFSTGGTVTGIASLLELQDLNIYPLGRRHAGQLGILTNKTVYQLEPDLITWSLKSLGGEISIPNLLPIGDGASEAGILLRGAAGTLRRIDFYSGLDASANLRWRQEVNASPETGSNAGSDFVLTRYSDLGVPLDDILTIARNTGTSTFSGAVEAPNFFGTFTGNLVGNITGTVDQANKLATPRTIGMTGDLIWTSPAFDGSAAVTAAGLLAVVNADVGTYGSASFVPIITVNAKGLITSVSTAPVAGASPPNLFPVGDGVGTAGLLIQGGVGTARVVDFYAGTASVANLRWRLQADGSGFFRLTPYSDTGVAALEDAFSINRATGDMTVPASITSGSFFGSLTGSVIGSVIGNVTGNLAGDVTGNVQGDVSGNAGTASLLAAGRTIGMSGDVSYTSGLFNGSANVTGIATLATVNSTPGTYGSTTLIPVFTVDAKGRITSITTVTVEGGGTGGGGGGTVPEGGTGQTTLGLNGVLIGQGINPVLVSNPGVIGQVFTSNGPGAPPSFQALTATLADEAIKLQTPRTIGITGDLTYTSTGFDGSAPVTGVGTLATVNANVGAYGSDVLIPVVSVNAKGLVTGISTVALGNAPTASVLSPGRTIGMTGDVVWTSPIFTGAANVTAASTLATVNSNVGSFGSGSQIPVFTVNAKGLVTAVSTAAVVIGNAATATALQTGRTIGMTGDVDWTSPTFNGTANVTAVGTLATVNSNVGSFGSGSQIPIFTVNAKGLITAVSTATVVASSAGALNPGATIGMTGDVTWTSPTFTGTGPVTAVSTLATVNANPGTWGGETIIPRFTVNAKGLITSAGYVSMGNAPTANTFVASVTAIGDPAIEAGLQIQGASATSRKLEFYSGWAFIGLNRRWRLEVDATAESGSNAGSDMVLTRFSDTGASLSVAMSISRSTGAVNFSGQVGAASFVGAISGNATTATALATGRAISITGDLAYTSGAFDGTAAVTGVGTLASVNPNVGSFGSATLIPTFTVNAKGLITSAGTVALGNAPTATALATGRTISITGDLAYTSASFTGAANVTGAGTLATVNSNVGTFGSTTLIPVVTVNAKGLVTAISTVTAAGGGGGGGSLIIPFGFTAGDKVNVIPNGKIVGYSTYRQAGVITGFSIGVDTGTAVVKIWKRATGTTVPTVADAITTAGLQLTTGTYIRSNTVTDLTTTAVAAGDIFVWDVTVSGCKEITFGLEITPT